jgi:hypothetical protein
MAREVYRYRFDAGVPIAEVEATIVLSLFGVEALHGEAQTRLDAAHFLDIEGRALVIDAGTPVGKDLNLLFAGFTLKEFGLNSFQVERVEGASDGGPPGVPVATAEAREHADGMVVGGK